MLAFCLSHNMNMELLGGVKDYWEAGSYHNQILDLEMTP